MTPRIEAGCESEDLSCAMIECVGHGRARRALALLALGVCLAAPLAARAQEAAGSSPAIVVKDPRGPEMAAYREQQKKREAFEKELKKFRSDFFRTARPAEVRAKAIEKLKQYTDPALFPSLVEIFSTEGTDVRLALLDHFTARKSDEGDTTLAWIGVFDKSKEIREAAARRLKERMAGKDSIPDRVQWVLYEGLAHGSEDAIAASAGLINTLNIVEAIPFLIDAQAGTQGGGGAGGAPQERTGALAYIFIGKQTTYVSDLTPVVSNSAVAFDPTVDVVSDGVVLQVLDAQVVVFRGPVRTALRDMVDRNTGLSTAHLGWRAGPWHEWYARTFVPALEKRRAEAKASTIPETK